MPLAIAAEVALDPDDPRSATQVAEDLESAIRRMGVRVEPDGQHGLSVRGNLLGASIALLPHLDRARFTITPDAPVRIGYAIAPVGLYVSTALELGLFAAVLFVTGFTIVGAVVFGVMAISWAAYAHRLMAALARNVVRDLVVDGSMRGHLTSAST